MEINDSTKISLYAALSVLPVLVGGIFWVTSIYSTAADAQRINDRQDRQIQNQTEILTDIRERVIRIEEQLKRR